MLAPLQLLILCKMMINNKLLCFECETGSYQSLKYPFPVHDIGLENESFSVRSETNLSDLSSVVLLH